MSGELHGEVPGGYGHHPAVLAVDDGDRAAPVALARDQPVAQAVVDRRVAFAFAIEPAHDLRKRLAVAFAVEARIGVDKRSVAAEGQALRRARPLLLRAVEVGRRRRGGAFDDTPDRQVVRNGEGVVALVVRGDRHDRAGAVLHQHVVRDVHRDVLAVDGVRHRLSEWHTGLRPLGGTALLVGLGQHVVDVIAHRLLVGGSLRETEHVGVLGRHHEERRPEQRVGTGGEDGVVDRKLLAAEHHLGALGAPDPVALHRLDVLGPVDPIEVPEQPLGVVGNAQEPLLELAHLDLGATALAAAVEHLLVGEHRLISRAPLDRGLLAVGKSRAQQLQEDPLRPAVVARFVRGQLARPVDRDAPGTELPLEGGDRGRCRDARVHPGLDRMVLGRQAEGVVAHRVQHQVAEAATEVRDRVADRVHLEVTDVRLAARVRKHLEHVRGQRRRLAGCGRIVGNLPRALVRPHRLPAGLDLGRVVVALLTHVAAGRLASTPGRNARASAPTRSHRSARARSGYRARTRAIARTHVHRRESHRKIQYNPAGSRAAAPPGDPRVSGCCRRCAAA